MPNKIAIITARGGSKRIPKKNIKDFLGKPIISYSIETALKSKLFDEVMVSTDDEEISKIAIQYGATVPFLRSKKNSDDFTGTAQVLIEVLEKYIEMGESYDHVCCIYPTAPFISSERLEKAYELMLNKNYKSVFPIVCYSSPIQRALRVSNSKVSMFQSDYINKRSQDLEKAYYDAGQFYWFQTKFFLKDKTLHTDMTGGIILSDFEAHDIDTPEDWEMAELKYNINIKPNE